MKPKVKDVFGIGWYFTLLEYLLFSPICRKHPLSASSSTPDLTPEVLFFVTL